MSLKTNANKIHSDLTSLYEGVKIEENSNRELGNFVEFRVVENNKELVLSIRKYELEKDIFNWSYLSNPKDANSVVERVSNINSFLSDIKDIFEKKMDQMVGVVGNSLSGGQRQIVWLLRSIYRPSAILILDEPTSALDPDNKLVMIDTIKKLSIGKTVIIVSHDDIDPTFRKISMKEGRVVNSSFF